MDAFFEKAAPEVKKYLFPLSLGILGLILSSYGLIQSFPQKAQPDEIMFTAEGEESNGGQEKTNSEITIDVSGAVNEPGVYTLEEGSRIKDAIEMAGGLNVKADSDFFTKSFNMAAKLTDGSKIYIPEIGEGIGSSTDNAISYSTQEVAGIKANDLININSATDAELDTLSGVGPVTARKIIDSRPYTSIDELLSKKVVSSSVFEKLKDKVSVY